MELSQQRLTKSEWENIEIPICQKEKDIIAFLTSCYESNNLLEKRCNLLSLSGVLKVQHTPDMELFLATMFFKDCIPSTTKKCKPIKKADQIRIESNSANDLSRVWEMRVLKFLTEKNHLRVFKLLQLPVINKNDYVERFAKSVLEKDPFVFDFKLFDDDENDDDYDVDIIEYKLFDHQQHLFSSLRNDKFEENHQQFINDNVVVSEGSLIKYVAPTGTGKTLSPIILSNQFRVIFLCAARHVGLSLSLIHI